MRRICFFLLLLHSAFLHSQADSANPLQSMVLSICNKVESENRLAGNMDPQNPGDLPFGLITEIGPTHYIIAIDSAKFRTGNAVFSAFMAMEFPGSQQKICFAAQNVAFNPKGVMPGPNTKLVLVSEHRISLGPNTAMVLKPDGYNYVEWDCNGFQSVNLKGTFEFSPGMIYPDPEFSPDSVVKAAFQIHTNDIHNFIVQVTMAPFCIRGLSDLSFSVLDATADLSELANAPNMNFPSGYDLSNCNGDPLMWTGFYMRQFRVRLPKELSKNGARPEILATNLLIDNSGVSGLFSAVNLFSCAQGSMNGWGFSVNTFQLSLTSNHVNGGGIAGYVRLPVSDGDSLAYAATIFQNAQTGETDYAFALSPAANFKANVLSATITIANTSQLVVAKNNGKLKPIAILNGNISFFSANVRAKELSFQQLTIASEAPVLRAGIFSLTPANPDSNKLGGFTFGLTMIQVGLANGQPAIAFGATVNFTDVGSVDIGAAAGFTILTQTASETDPAGGAGATKISWIFERVRVENISLAFNSGPFHLNGTIIFKDNDPVYGKGFFGQIAMSIEKVLQSPALASVWFGKVDGYRYFYADAAVPVVIPLGGVSIYRFMGGVYYHMQRPATASLESQLYSNAFGGATGYLPSVSTGLGIKAGITLGTSGNAKTCNGDLALELTFNTTGGISQISFNGNVGFMCTIQQRVNTPPSQLPAIASLLMNYDFTNDALHAVMGIQVHLPGVNGSGQAMMHFDPGIWYLYIGRPQTRISVTFGGIATLSAYFEVGQAIDPMPPPPENVTSVVNMSGLSNQRNTTALENASGFAFGASFGSGFNGQLGFENWYIYYGIAAGAGFDIMVLDYGPNAHCTSGGSAGANGWYAMGQLYAYLQGEVGIHGRVAGQDFDFVILSLSAAAILQAKLPNPTWVGGAVGCDYDVLGGLVSGHVDFNFELGNQCTVVN
ncbi:MAG TPA: hypothetical protein VI731_01840 [Bacteroidia bacterium]|nr:hypothetical protein [Bacteroidia bacterium]